MVRADPLSPTVSFLRFRSRAIVWTRDVGQRLQPEDAGVILIRPPRRELDLRDLAYNIGIVAECKSRPFFDDRFRTQVRVPCQSGESIEIGQRKMIRQPIATRPDVGDADVSA